VTATLSNIHGHIDPSLTRDQRRALLDIYGPMWTTDQLTGKQIAYTLRTGQALGVARELEGHELNEALASVSRYLAAHDVQPVKS
jgi:hypothetical protein